MFHQPKKVLLITSHMTIKKLIAFFYNKCFLNLISHLVLSLLVNSRLARLEANRTKTTKPTVGIMIVMNQFIIYFFVIVSIVNMEMWLAFAGLVTVGELTLVVDQDRYVVV
jgi:hypothetical protein